MARGRAPQANVYFEAAAGFLTGDRIEDLDVEERLDAAINRVLKRLWNLQAAREFRRSGEPKLISSTPLRRLKKPDDAAPTDGE